MPQDLTATAAYGRRGVHVLTRVSEAARDVPEQTVWLVCKAVSPVLRPTRGGLLQKVELTESHS